MRRLKSVEIVASLSIQYSGASIQRQLTSPPLVISDSSFWLALLIVSYAATLVSRAYDWLFIGWGDDLRLINAALELWVWDVVKLLMSWRRVYGPLLA